MNIESQVSIFESPIAIIGAVSTFITIFISILEFIHKRMKSISEYYESSRNVEVLERRKKIYNMNDGDIVSHDDDIDISHIINLYQYWEIMVKKHYLSPSVFKKDSCIGVIRIFEKLYPTIKKRRENNELYAYYFEWLYRKSIKYREKVKRRHDKMEKHHKRILNRYKLLI